MIPTPFTGPKGPARCAVPPPAAVKGVGMIPQRLDQTTLSLRQWLLMIAGVTVVGCLLVGQRNALVMQGYAVGAQVKQLHTHATDVAWLEADVTRLASPMHLARAVQQHHLTLVARSTLVPSRGLASGRTWRPLLRQHNVPTSQPDLTHRGQRDGGPSLTFAALSRTPSSREGRRDQHR